MPSEFPSVRRCRLTLGCHSALVHLLSSYKCGRVNNGKDLRLATTLFKVAECIVTPIHLGKILFAGGVPWHPSPCVLCPCTFFSP